MLFYGHTASFLLHLAAIAGISLGATLLSILSPFGLSEADSHLQYLEQKVGQAQHVIESHRPDHCGWCGMDIPLPAQALAFGSHCRELGLSLLVDVCHWGPNT